MVDVNILDDVKLPICTSPVVRENFLAMEYSVFQAYERDLTPVLQKVTLIKCAIKFPMRYWMHF